MLEQSDCKFIETNGWIMDNDWELLSCLLGEPFLFDGFLCFWDGTHAVICGWPVERSAMAKDMKERLFSAAQECLGLFFPKLIEVWGPQNVSLDPILPSNYMKAEEISANPNNVNIQIQYAEYEMIKTRKNRSYQNAMQAERAGVYCKITKGSDFTWQHFAMLEKFLTRDDLGTFDRTYSALAPILTRSRKTTMFQACQDEEILGFILVREVLKDVAIATWGSYKNGPLHPSDFLHLKMIEYYQHTEKPILDMGYSAHINLLKYKQNWGANINNGSYYSSAYVQDKYQMPNGYSHWWARELLQPVLLPRNTRA